MSDRLCVRSAVEEDAAVVVRIGREGVTTQYIGLVDPAAAEAGVPQTYSVSPITACIDRCDGAELAEFLVTGRSRHRRRILCGTGDAIAGTAGSVSWAVPVGEGQDHATQTPTAFRNDAAANAPPCDLPVCG